MTAIPRTTSLLWALRSYCGSHTCKPCYFTWLDEQRVDKTPGMLSHFSPHDLPTEQVMAFARALPGSAVRRVFLAGGEPLMWRPILDLIKILKGGGLEVVVCTSGVALNQPNMARLVELGVSVSLDSTDPDYNDTWRPPRKEGDGWECVISGIKALLAARGTAARPRVGLYTVITKLNLADILGVPQLAADLGCDYAVPQPVALPEGHSLHDTLALTAELPRPRKTVRPSLRRRAPAPAPAPDLPPARSPPPSTTSPAPSTAASAATPCTSPSPTARSGTARPP